MSKYYNAKDVLRLLSDEYYSQGKAGNLTTWGAIKELPTIEVSEDCISRADLIKQMIDYQNFDTVNTYKAIGAAYCVELAVNAPSVVPSTEQSSEVGEWKWKSQDTCDNCGYEIPHLERIVGETVLMDSRDWNFCPNCGAKMKGN